MKAPKKPFIVEVKNRRRQSSREHSIWAGTNLKAASRQIISEQRAESDHVVMDEQQPGADVKRKADDLSA